MAVFQGRVSDVFTFRNNKPGSSCEFCLQEEYPVVLDCCEFIQLNRGDRVAIIGKKEGGKIWASAYRNFTLGITGTKVSSKLGMLVGFIFIVAIIFSVFAMINPAIFVGLLAIVGISIYKFIKAYKARSDLNRLEKLPIKQSPKDDPYHLKLNFEKFERTPVFNGSAYYEGDPVLAVGKYRKLIAETLSECFGATGEKMIDRLNSIEGELSGKTVAHIKKTNIDCNNIRHSGILPSEDELAELKSNCEKILWELKLFNEPYETPLEFLRCNTPDFEGKTDIWFNDLSPILTVFLYSGRIEKILKYEYGADGSGIKDLAYSVRDALPKDIYSVILKIGSLRNEIANEEDFEIRNLKGLKIEAESAIKMLLEDPEAPETEDIPLQAKNKGAQFAYAFIVPVAFLGVLLFIGNSYLDSKGVEFSWFEAASESINKAVAETVPTKSYGLTINTVPSDCRVRIMNIGPVYHPGIKLTPGTYDILVDTPGHISKRFKVEISNSDTSKIVVLEKIETPEPTALDKLKERVKYSEPKHSRQSLNQVSPAEDKRHDRTESVLDVIEIYRVETAYKIQKNWAFSEQLNNKERTLQNALTFKVMPSGEIRDLFFNDRSGNVQFDDSAYGAVINASPVDPHPEAINRPYVQMVLRFVPEGIK